MPKKCYFPVKFVVSSNICARYCRVSESCRVILGSKNVLMLYKYTYNRRICRNFHKMLELGALSHIVKFLLATGYMRIFFHRQSLHKNVNFDRYFKQISYSFIKSEVETKCKVNFKEDKQSRGQTFNISSLSVKSSVIETISAAYHLHYFASISVT